MRLTRIRRRLIPICLAVAVFALIVSTLWIKPRGEIGHKTKVLWVDHFSSQMDRAASHYADLVALAKEVNRSLVEPYVQEGKISGRPESGHIRDGKRRLFSFYYDTASLNRLLLARGHYPLLSVDDLLAECGYGWDVVVLLLFRHEKLMQAVLRRGYADELRECQNKAEQSPTATADCPALAKITRSMPESMGFRKEPYVGRVVAVDMKRFHSPALLEKDVFQGKPCAQIMVWAGQGKTRAEFNLPEKAIIAPSELRYNPLLLNTAEEFVKDRIRGPFVGVHIQGSKQERKVSWSVDKLLTCFKQVGKAVNEQRNWVAKHTVQSRPVKQVKVLFATAKFLHGFNMPDKQAERKDNVALLKYSLQLLKGALVLDKQELKDSGAQAIVEMHVLQQADSIVVMGGGKFQGWIVSHFKKKHEERGNIQHVCRASVQE